MSGPPLPPITVLVLAGGAARRMGGSKADLRIGARTLLEHALALAAGVSRHTLLLPGQRPLTPPDGVPVVADWGAGDNGPLGALAAGLAAAPTEWVLLLPCDMPFMSVAVVEVLRCRAAVTDRRVVAFRTRGGLEPFAGLYHQALTPAVLSLLESGRRSLKGLLDGQDVETIDANELLPLDPGLRFLHNVNTPGDLEAARAEE